MTYEVDDYELINYEQKIFDKEKIASILENRHNKIKVDIEDPINHLYVELNVWKLNIYMSQLYEGASSYSSLN